ncbi:MAG: hypothetical protein A4E52_01955 [Pelotomaculum sp. PtaB.Bin013]|nr:MAG: hypothetical protein A4E52_01955 [Pelotomaculum sp. PtaB.Bin013]
MQLKSSSSSNEGTYALTKTISTSGQPSTYQRKYRVWAENTAGETDKEDYFVVKPNSNIPVLKYGSTGDDVAVIQAYLWNGAQDPYGQDSYGKYGYGTQLAVGVWQEQYNKSHPKDLIEADGNVSEKTWGAMGFLDAKGNLNRTADPYMKYLRFAKDQGYGMNPNISTLQSLIKAGKAYVWYDTNINGHDYSIIKIPNNYLNTELKLTKIDDLDWFRSNSYYFIDKQTRDFVKDPDVLNKIQVIQNANAIYDVYQHLSNNAHYDVVVEEQRGIEKLDSLFAKAKVAKTVAELSAKAEGKLVAFLAYSLIPGGQVGAASIVESIPGDIAKEAALNLPKDLITAIFCSVIKEEKAIFPELIEMNQQINSKPKLHRCISDYVKAQKYININMKASYATASILCEGELSGAFEEYGWADWFNSLIGQFTGDFTSGASSYGKALGKLKPLDAKQMERFWNIIYTQNDITDMLEDIYGDIKPIKDWINAKKGSEAYYGQYLKPQYQDTYTYKLVFGIDNGRGKSFTSENIPGKDVTVKGSLPPVLPTGTGIEAGGW